MGDGLMKKGIVVFMLALLLLSVASMTLQTSIATPEEEKGPPLDKIIWTVETNREVAIKKVVSGDIDVFLFGSPWKFYEKLSEEDRAKLTLVKAASGLACLEPNWAGALEYGINDTIYPAIVNVTGGEGESYREDGIYFNPFAIREIRYALNWLINREEIVETVLGGSGAPMLGAIGPSHPANASLYKIYQQLGLSPEGNPTKSKAMLDEALEKINNTWKDMGAPYRVRRDAEGWLEFYDGTQWKDVEINFFIRIEDERHELGLHVAQVIENQWKIKVNEYEYDRTVVNTVIYGSDPLAYQWDLYTAGWLSMAEEAYPDGNLLWYYFFTTFYKMPPGQVANASIQNVGWKLYLGLFENETVYWDLCEKLLAMGIQEGFRVFVYETWEYYPVNKERVNNIAAGISTGLATIWPFRTASTPDGVLRVAEFSSAGALFMSAWNPVGGFEDVYSEYMWKCLRDYGMWTDPLTGEYVPVRLNWTVTKDYEIDPVEGEFVGKLDVPTTAMVYNTTTNKWENVGSGVKACAKVVFNYAFSKWHNGIPMDMSDVLATIAFYWEWAFEDEEGDPFYHEELDYLQNYFATMKGFEVINETALAVYTDYIFTIDDSVIASYCEWWPTVPWEVLTVMEYCVVNGGPATGKTYDWTEYYEEYGKEEWIDMLNLMHVSDYKSAAELINSTEPVHWFKPNYTKYGDYTPTDDECKTRWETLLSWIDEYEHICISNGPYVLVKWDPVARYLEMDAFRDETYPFGPDYWLNKLPEESILNPGVPEEEAPPERKFPLLWVGVGVAAVVIVIVAAVVLRKKP